MAIRCRPGKEHTLSRDGIRIFRLLMEKYVYFAARGQRRSGPNRRKPCRGKAFSDYILHITAKNGRIGRAALETGWHGVNCRNPDETGVRLCPEGGACGE